MGFVGEHVERSAADLASEQGLDERGLIDHDPRATFTRKPSGPGASRASRLIMPTEDALALTAGIRTSLGRARVTASATQG
jgi:hypothetical protein